MEFQKYRSLNISTKLEKPFDKIGKTDYIIRFVQAVPVCQGVKKAGSCRIEFEYDVDDQCRCTEDDQL